MADRSAVTENSSVPSGPDPNLHSIPEQTSSLHLSLPAHTHCFTHNPLVHVFGHLHSSVSLTNAIYAEPLNL